MNEIIKKYEEEAVLISKIILMIRIKMKLNGLSRDEVKLFHLLVGRLKEVQNIIDILNTRNNH